MSVSVVFVLNQPRAIVAGEEYVRLLFDPVLPEGVQDSTDVKVDLFNHVSVEASLAFAFEFRRCVELCVWHCVRNVDEERFVEMFFHEADCFVRIPLR